MILVDMRPKVVQSGSCSGVVRIARLVLMWDIISAAGSWSAGAVETLIPAD